MGDRPRLNRRLSILIIVLLVWLLTAMVIGAVGTVLTAGYLLWMLQKVNLGEPGAEWDGHEFHDADRFELAAWVPLIVTIIAIGVYPKFVFGATTDAVQALVQTAFGG